MAIRTVVILDRVSDQPNSAPKPTKRGGDYRFALRYESTSGDLSCEIKGFRADPKLERIIPPVSMSRNTIYNIIKLGPKQEKKILDYLREETNNTVNFTAPEYASAE